MPVKSIFSRAEYAFWIGLSLSIALAALTIALRVPEAVPEADQAAYLVGCIGFAAACLTVPPALDLSRNWTLNWTSGLQNFIQCKDHDAEEQFRRDVSPYFTRRRLYVVGAVWAIVATTVAYHWTFYGQIQDAGARIVGMIAIFSAEFLAGAGLTALFGLARAIRRIGHRRDCPVRLSRDRFGVLSTGTLMFKC